MGYRKLGRNSSARKALFRSILTSFFRHERIETTEAKAKEISGLAEQIITLAKRGDLSARRMVIARLMDEEVARKLYSKAQSIIEEAYTVVANKNKFIPQIDLYKIHHFDGMAKTSSC